MMSIVLSAGCAFLLCFTITPVLRYLLRRAGSVDRPDGYRRLHSSPVPRLGGIAIAASYAGACLIASRFGQGDSLAPVLWRLLPAAVVVFATGLLDDIFGLTARQKLVGLFAGAGLAY